MTALFETGFFVRKPAWHLGGNVLDEYPATREEAYVLAGHDYKIVRHYAGMEGLIQLTCDERNERILAALPVVGPIEGKWYAYERADENAGFKVDHRRADGTVGPLDGNRIAILGSTFTEIQNAAAYDIAELLFEQGFEWETGITLDGGATCALTLKLDEAIQIAGDDSLVLPFGCLSWSHDGTGSLRVRTGTIRQVCANTVSASEAEGKRLGTDFTFRHTKNVHERIQDAKKAIAGARQAVTAYQELAEELSAIEVTPAQRDLFISEILGETVNFQPITTTTAVSKRVKTNVENETTKIASLFFGPTIPDAHALTGYGLFLAGGEYFDHLRNYRSQESYVKRTLLTDNPAKKDLAETIRKVALVG